MAPAAFFSLASRVLACFAATSTLAYADDLPGLSFGLNSLIWMLIGALGWGSVSYWLGQRSGRRSGVPSAPISMPVTAKPADKPMAARSEKDDGGDERSANLSEYLTPLDEATTVTVEELSDIVEQVDLFLLLGRHEMAISMLLSRIGAENDNDPRTWFKLLDIYHALQDRINFEKLANDIRVRFNVALPSWEDSALQAEGLHGLECFPHLLARISDDWGTPSSLGYLQSLVKDNRGGERTGFDEDAFREVMLLIGILDQKSGL